MVASFLTTPLMTLKKVMRPAKGSVMVLKTTRPAGSLSAMVATLAMQDGVAPPTINLDTPDPECDLDYVPNVARPMTIDTAMVNAFGFGGQNACLAIAAA